jgi:hypothetical protein
MSPRRGGAVAGMIVAVIRKARQRRAGCRSQSEIGTFWNCREFLSTPARILQGGAPLLFGLVLDNGRAAARPAMGSLTGLSFLALFGLSAPAPAPAYGAAANN